MTDWYTAKTREREVVYKRLHAPEVIETGNGKTVADPGNYVVQWGDGTEEEFTENEFERKFKIQ